MVAGSHDKTGWYIEGWLAQLDSGLACGVVFRVVCRVHRVVYVGWYM